MGYYRRFIPDFATVAKPLNRLTSKKADFSWGEEEEFSFNQLREAMLSAPVLAYPSPEAGFIVDTDASNDAAGAVLSQCLGGEERAIAYYSKTFSLPQRNYCVTRRELLAVVMAVNHFRPYLYGKKFKLRTDHASLVWLYKRSEPSHQVARWIEILSEFDFTIEHRAGAKHGNADGLSRCSDCKQCSRIEERDGGPRRTEEGDLGDNRVATLRLGNSRADSELRDAQDAPGSDLSSIKTHVRNQTSPSSRELELGSEEFRRLAKLLPHMRLQQELLQLEPPSLIEIYG